MAKRNYRLKKRAEQQEATRSKIVDATVALHEELGPARTTISAIANRAGVERLTVYRHFPDQNALLRACSSQFLKLTPPPDPLGWEDLEKPAARTRRALEAFYDYFRETEGMWTSVLRDAEMEAVAEVVAGFQQLLDRVRDDLVGSWRPPRGRRNTVRALLGHAIAFQTWQSLSSRGLGNRKIASLVVDWIEAELAR